VEYSFTDPSPIGKEDIVDTINASNTLQGRPQLHLPTGDTAAPRAIPTAASVTNAVVSTYSEMNSSNKESVDSLLSSRKELAHAMDELKRLADNSGRTLGFSQDEALNGPVITVSDLETGKVVRQIPTEVVVRVAHSIEKMKGLLFDKSL